MASEIRVDKINSLSGVGTVTLSPTGVDIAGITTASTLRATTGIITTLQVGTISGDGSSLTGVASTENIRTNTNATFLQNVNVSGTSTISGDVNIADTIAHIGDNSKIRFPANDQISFETGGTEIARFDNNQLFLVGATSAVNSSSAKVQVAHTNANARIDIARFSADDAPPYLEFHKSRNGTVGGNTIVNDGDELGRIRWSGNNGSTTTAGAEIRTHVDGSPGSSNDMPGRMVFYTTGDGSGTPSEAMRITQQQRVSISAGASPSAKLDVASTSDSVRGLRVSGGASGGTEIAQFRTNNGTARFTVNNDVTVETGNLVIGTSGKGIDFSAASGSASGSSTAILDDYEEGTWTPTYLFGGSDTSTYTNRSGSYTKIGDFIFAKFAVDISSKGSGSGRIDIGGLPFTIGDKLTTTGQEVGGMISYWNATSAVNMINYWGQNGNNYVQLQYTSGSGATTITQYLSAANIADNTGFRGYIIYNSS